MVKQDRYYGADRYLPHAVAATAAVVVIPSVVVVALMIALDGELAPLLAAIVGAALAVMVAGVGSVLWSHSSGALDVAFSELLIWGWVRRKRADERAARDARLLGLDTQGRPTQPARSARAQQLAILGDLSSALESKDPYTHGHSQRVERHSIRTALELDLTVTQLAQLRRAAALHDVGKIRVPHRILRKPGSLTPEERRLIEQHSVVGAWLVSNVCEKDVVAAVRHHHERWDGRGYPDGLGTNHIPLFARIIAVADSFDAMTSTRPYRVAYDSRTAVEILEAEAGAQFDPDVVRAFVSTVPSQTPIAAFLPFLGVGLVRKLAGGLRRALSGTALTGAATAGTAAVLVASLLSPVDTSGAGTDRGGMSPPALAAPAAPNDLPTVLADDLEKETTEARSASSAEGAAGSLVLARKASKPKRVETVVLGDRVTRAQDPERGERPSAHRPRATPDEPDGGDGADDDGDPLGDGDDDGTPPDNGNPNPPGSGNPNPPGDDDDNDNDNDSENDSENDNENDNAADGDDESDDNSGRSKEPKGDPQPERGKDCPAKPGSPGSQKHCS